MKNLRKFKYFLGLKVARNKTGFYLSNCKYVLDIVSEAGLLGAKPSPVPVELNYKLASEEGPLANAQQYRRLVGRLIYFTNIQAELGCYLTGMQPSV